MTLKLPCILYTCILILPMTRRPQSTCALYTSAHYNRDNTVLAHYSLIGSYYGRIFDTVDTSWRLLSVMINAIVQLSQHIKGLYCATNK